jgi:hypothetical protein
MSALDDLFLKDLQDQIANAKNKNDKPLRDACVQIISACKDIESSVTGSNVPGDGPLSKGLLAIATELKGLLDSKVREPKIQGMIAEASTHIQTAIHHLLGSPINAAQ